MNSPRPCRWRGSTSPMRPSIWVGLLADSAFARYWRAGLTSTYPSISAAEAARSCSRNRLRPRRRVSRPPPDSKPPTGGRGDLSASTGPSNRVGGADSAYPSSRADGRPSTPPSSGGGASAPTYPSSWVGSSASTHTSGRPGGGAPACPSSRVGDSAPTYPSRRVCDVESTCPSICEGAAASSYQSTRSGALAPAMHGQYRSEAQGRLGVVSGSWVTGAWM